MIAYNYGGAYDQYTGYCASNVGYNTFSQQYWERSLFQRCKALFDFTGLPDAAPNQVQWDNDAFLWGLFKLGFMTVFDTKTYGLVVQPVPCMAPLRGRSPAWARAGGPERIVPRRGL